MWIYTYTIHAIVTLRPDITFQPITPRMIHYTARPGPLLFDTNTTFYSRHGPESRRVFAHGLPKWEDAYAEYVDADTEPPRPVQLMSETRVE